MAVFISDAAQPHNIGADQNMLVKSLADNAPLILMGDRERCIAVGAKDYLSKPVNMQKLLEIIHARIAAKDKK